MTDRGCASPDHPSLAARVLVRRATRDAHPFLCADVVRSARRELSASCLASAAAICSCRLREPLATRRAHLLRPCDGQRDPAALDRARCRALVALCGISLVVNRGYNEHCHMPHAGPCCAWARASYPLDMSRPFWWSNASLSPQHTRSAPVSHIYISFSRETRWRARARGAAPRRARASAGPRARPHAIERRPDAVSVSLIKCYTRLGFRYTAARSSAPLGPWGWPPRELHSNKARD